MLEGAGGPDSLQTSPDGQEQYRNGNFRLLRSADGALSRLLNFRGG